MIIRLALALPLASEQQFYQRLLPTTRDTLQIALRIDPHGDVAEQLVESAGSYDIVVYDPVIDSGRGLTLWTQGKVPEPLIYWCSDQEFEDAPLVPGLAYKLGPTCSGIDVDVAIRRCRRLMLAKASAPVMMARSPVASYAPDVVSFPHTRGIEVRPCESIVHIEGQGNYSTVVFINEPKLLLSRTIGDFEDVLPGSEFVRVHRSHIINMRHVRRILPGRRPRVQLANGDEVCVSNRYRGILMDLLNVIKRK